MELDLHRLLRRSENPELPVSALRAMVELRSGLDELERLAVRSARDKGATWDEIARALGVTRQAVQQRHRAGVHGHAPARAHDSELLGETERP